MFILKYIKKAKVFIYTAKCKIIKKYNKLSIIY